MKNLRKLLSNWRKPVKFAAYDPQNFDELFGVTTSRINLFSLVFLFILVISFFSILIISKTSLGGHFFGSNQSADRTMMMDQHIRLDSLKSKIDAQELYIVSLNSVLFGKVSSDSIVSDSKEVAIDLSKINDNASKAELKLADNVKADQYTTPSKVEQELALFFNPVKGLISRKFNNKDHQAVDIVAKHDAYFSACLSGTVIYSDFSRNDGYVLIIEHSNDFISIYKHAKAIFKKRGDRVQVGEIIGIVGDTGINLTGAHLHFELWLNQKPVDPSNYIQFQS